MNSGIYALVNRRNGKRYIGRTVDFHKREITHYWLLKSHRHFNIHLQRAWDAGDEFDFEIIEECNPDKCNEREVYWINACKTMDSKYGYNLCEGGKSTTGYKFSDEAKQKISIKASGRKCSIETIQKRKESLRKHIEQDESFAKYMYERRAAGLKGKPSWNAGLPCPEWKKKQVSEKLKGRYISDDHRQKLRELYTGEKSLSAKLKERDVVDIRYRYLNGEKQADICKDYPVRPQTIYDIVHFRRWRSVPNTLEELEVLRCRTEAWEADRLEQN